MFKAIKLFFSSLGYGFLYVVTTLWYSIWVYLIYAYALYWILGLLAVENSIIKSIHSFVWENTYADISNVVVSLIIGFFIAIGKIHGDNDK